MKSFISVFSFLFIFIASFSCTNPATKDKQVPKGDTSKNALDWEGVYEGTVPCADCEGIATTLEIDYDNNFELKTKYLGKSEEEFSYSGDFTWNEKGNIITLKGVDNRPSQYLVGENQLFQLDMEGERITGELADKYRLIKK
ncbi:copper resistance protein NlpE [Pleomorphovibrio marinus]|uniref:copper resistance protein NlpE n=1 Tax=Pleomorphovibrio marinus TaxID=2164132 RepID=UPI000E0AE41F|nr:copper resistance protein NlpE [Pleomorphovibrio marinus]